MCMIDDCDPSDVWNALWPVALKSHRCGECGREIESGERYERVTSLHDGTWDTFKTCDHCQAARKWLMLVCGGWVHDRVGEDLRGHLEDYASMWLLRAAYGVRKAWRRPDGSLLPVLSSPNPASLKPTWERG